MCACTSVFGMLPLVLFPGAGSELYRGLGSVVLGGLMLSAVLTVLIIPPLLSLARPLLEKRRGPRDPRPFPKLGRRNSLGRAGPWWSTIS